MATLRLNHVATMSSRSTTIDGKSIAAVCFSYQQLLEARIRQEQLCRDARTRIRDPSPYTVLVSDFVASIMAVSGQSKPACLRAPRLTGQRRRVRTADSAA
jgi:hypothetical protein